MAKSAKDLDGWQLVITDANGNVIDENSTADRRSRRTRGASTKIHLEKEIDGVVKKLKFGTFIIAKKPFHPHKETVYMITEIRMNSLSSYIELWSFELWDSSDLIPSVYFKFFKPDLLKSNETDEYYQDLFDKEVGPNKLFFTLQPKEISLHDIVCFPNIIKGSDWNDSCTQGQDYIVDFMVNASGTAFAPININEQIELLADEPYKNVTESLNEIITVKKKNNARKAVTTKNSKRKVKKEQKATIDELSLLETDIESGDDGASESEDYVDEGNSKVDDQESEESDIEDEPEKDSDEEIDESEDEYMESDSKSNKRKKRVTNNVRKPKTTIKKEPGTKRKVRKVRVSKKKNKTPSFISNVRRFTKRNVVRAKKKYTPFSKQYRSIKDIPDLTYFGGFNQKDTNAYLEKLEEKLNTKSGHKIVETIFSKVKKQLYSSHGKEEIVKATNFGEYLPARENEFASIYLSVYSALESGSSTTIYIAGTPGVGKTLTVREVMKELQHSATEDELPLFQYIEINGLKMVKPTDSYEVLWNKISGDNLTWGASMESLQFYFEKVPRNKKRTVVVLLDELDALITKQEEIMYNFFNWTSYENAKLILIAVANTMDLPERQLGNKVSSRIGFTRIMFTGYTHQELKSIIDLRLKGLNDSFFYVDKDTGNAYLAEDFMANDHEGKDLSQYKKVRLRMSPDAIEIASRKIASVSGDARRALKACKRAAEIAEQDYMAAHGYNYDGQVIIAPIYEEGQDDEDDEEIKDIERKANGKATNSYEKERDEDGNEYEVQVVRINHVMKALNETINSNVTKFINRCSFSTKLFLFAFLNLIKKSGYEEQVLGDIVDEILLLIEVNGNNKFVMNMTDVLYPKVHGTEAPQLRIISWNFVINKLLEAGVLVKQNSNNERLSSIKLNVPIDDIRNAIDHDDHLKDF
ncbi:Origin recognition complex, subunit 1 [Maudiozyma exigua]|uniref:Origin recognition complex subunit 1 n=1 Tax=Maudiozyma exigua TaxID=34358 RepID=A0A9P7B8P8_MAUEX|nr:Origin recognition complex, subunit 1 [Kazachstania exigua]